MSGTVQPQPELRTPRLRLRPLRPADAGLIEIYSSDAKVARMTARIPHPYPPGLAETVVERAIARSGPATVWALDAGEDAENGLIGLIELEATGPGRADLGYWVAPAFWNTGYASEAVEAIVAHAGAAGLRELTASVFQENAASVKVLLRAGFAYVGEGETHSVARGAMVPTFRYHRMLAE